MGKGIGKGKTRGGCGAMGMRDRDGMMSGKGRKKCRLVQDSSHRSTFQMSFFFNGNMY